MTTRVTAGLQYTRNLGNFENARVHFEISDEVRKNETPDQAKARIYGKVEQWVEDAIKEIDAEARS